MRIMLYDNINSAAMLRSLEEQMLMFHGEGLLFFSHLKFEVVPEVKRHGLLFGSKKTVNVTYLVGGSFFGYNDDGEFLGVYDADKIKYIIQSYDLMALRKRYIKLEKAQKALLDKIDEIVAVKAGIHPSIIGSYK